jgi:tol-pal system protein YbgF
MIDSTQRILACGTALAALFCLCGAAPINNQNAVAHRHATELQLAGLFGESEEEKAARLAREQKETDQDAAIANLNDQVRDLQDTVRRLTGQNEVLSHKVEQFDSRVDRMQKDFDYKLCTMTAQQVGGDTAALPCNPNGDAATSYRAPLPQPSAQSFNDPASAPPRALAPPPGVLGSLPKPASQPTDAAAPAAASVASSYKAEFDSSLNLLGKAQYDEARASFRAYADNHPKDELAPQAVFWVGNIAYVQRDYPNAARAFAEEIKKYPSNSRAPESMLKLGQSLIAMGQKKEGCFTLGSLPTTYPKAPRTTVAQAAAASKAAACK